MDDGRVVDPTVFFSSDGRAVCGVRGGLFGFLLKVYCNEGALFQRPMASLAASAEKPDAASGLDACCLAGFLGAVLGI